MDPECFNEPQNHGLLIVGYGTNENLKMDYWICKNQWGTEWGMDGYAYVQRGTNTCRIAEDAYYIRV